MSTATTIRSQVEAALRDRIPSALTPPARTIRPVTPTGIRSVDEVLEGGLPVGTLTELVGGECSGRTSLALSFLAELTGSGKVCAWIDVSNSLNPESAAPSTWIFHGCCGSAAACLLDRFQSLQLQRALCFPRSISFLLPSRRAFTEEASASIRATRSRELRVLSANC